MKDDYVRFFVRRPTRRAPIINRGRYCFGMLSLSWWLILSIFGGMPFQIIAGYYARWSVLRTLLHQFLNAGKNSNNDKPKQILSLGAGFDTTFFQLQVSPLIPLLSQQDIDLICVDATSWFIFVLVFPTPKDEGMAPHCYVELDFKEVLRFLISCTEVQFTPWCSVIVVLWFCMLVVICNFSHLHCIFSPLCTLVVISFSSKCLAGNQQKSRHH
jgi:hypothetical protein